jgi:hypothetical protein
MSAGYVTKRKETPLPQAGAAFPRVLHEYPTKPLSEGPRGLLADRAPPTHDQPMSPRTVLPETASTNYGILLHSCPKYLLPFLQSINYLRGSRRSNDNHESSHEYKHEGKH